MIFRLYRNQPILAFAGVVMELSYHEDWKMAKGVIINIDRNVVNTRTCSDIKGHNFQNTEYAYGIFHILADEGLHFLAV